MLQKLSPQFLSGGEIGDHVPYGLLSYKRKIVYSVLLQPPYSDYFSKDVKGCIA